MRFDKLNDLAVSALAVEIFSFHTHVVAQVRALLQSLPFSIFRSPWAAPPGST